MANTESDLLVDSFFVGIELETEVEPVVLCIVCKNEENEDMAANLRTDFKERQCKHLSESILVVPPSTKKPYSKVLYPMSVSTVSPTPKPSTDGVGPNHVPIVRPSTGKYARLKLGKPSIGPAQHNDDSVECMAFVPLHPKASCALSWKEMAELLKQVPCLTESEDLGNNIGDLFPATRQVSMDLSGNPNISFVARLPFGTLESVASCIPPMKDYKVVENTEVVSLAPL